MAGSARRFAVVVAFFGLLNALGLWAIYVALRPPEPVVRVLDVSVHGEVPIGAPVRVEFDTDVLPAAAGELPTTVGLLELVPAVAGRTVWDGRRALVFRATESLPRATRLQLRVNDAVGRAVGLRLDGPREFAFHTPPLRFRGASQTAFTKDFEATLRLRFDDLVSPRDLEDHLRLWRRAGDDADGRGAVGYEVLTRKPSKNLDVRSTDAVEELWVRLSPGLRGASGPLGLAHAADVNVPLTHRLRFHSAESQTVFKGWPDLRLDFNQRVDAEAAGRIEDWIRVEPAVSFRVKSGWRSSSLWLEGEFRPGTMYRVTALKGLPGDGNSVLVADRSIDVSVPSREPDVEIASGGFLSPRGSGRFLIETTNVDEVEVVAHRVLPNNLVHYLASGRRSRYSSKRLLRTGPTRTLSVEGPRDELVETAVELRDLMRPGEDIRGLWFVRADTDRGVDTTLLMVTDLALTARSGRDEITVWATRLADGRPAARTHVSLWTRSNQIRAFGYTDDHGVLRLEGPFDEIDGAPWVILAENGGDVCYLRLDADRRSAADFDVAADLGGQPFRHRGYEAFVYTDRGVYRPGETVRVESIVRDARLDVPRAFPLECEIVRPARKTAHVLPVEFGREGAAGVSFDLDEAALTGRWEAHLRLPSAADEGAPTTADGPKDASSGERLGTVRFLVEDFAPQRLRVAIRLAPQLVEESVGDVDGEAGDGEAVASAPAARTRFQPGERVDVIVRGELLAGLPAAGERVRLDYSLRTGRFAGLLAGLDKPALGHYGFGDATAERIDRDGSVGEAVLDANGEARITVEIPGARSSTPLVLSLDATVHDASGRPVRGGLDLAVDPAPFYLGLRDDAGGRPPIGKPFRVTCAAVRPDGGDIEDFGTFDDLELVVERVDWSSVLKKSSSGRYRWESKEDVDEIERRSIRLDAGHGGAELVLSHYGRYRLTLRDKPSGVTTTREVRVVGDSWSGSSNLSTPERVDLEVLSTIPRPGGEARVRVQAPFAGTLLVAVETDRVLHTEVVEMAENRVEVDVPIPVEIPGNAWVTASVVRAVDVRNTSGERWLPHRAWGIAPLWIDFTPEHLLVTLDARPHLEPGGEALIRARVTGRDGQPRRAEVALALVDEGILAWTDFQTPAPWSFFYGRRAHGVTLADMFSALSPEVALDVKRAKPGGGFGASHRRRLNQVGARRFRPTALWLGSFATDEDGALLADFTVPDFTGELRLMAIAHAGRSFGSHDRAITVRPPLHLEIGMPRFLAPGDRIVTAVDVFNSTGAAGEATLELETGGPLRRGNAPASSALAFAATEGKTVSLARGARERLELSLAAEQEVGVATLRVRGDLGEFSRVESVELAVRPAAPLVTNIQSGSVTADEPVELTPGGGFLAGTTRHRLVVAPLPDLDLLGPLRDLVRYPHGCLEQTTSKIFPQIYLRDLSLLLEDDYSGDRAKNLVSASDRDRATEHVRDGIERLRSMMLRGGGMSMWPGSTRVWRWGTLYAAHCLVEARRAGFDVPAADLDLVLAWIDAQVVRARSGTVRDVERAYGIYVRALADKTDGLTARIRSLMTTGDDDGATTVALSTEARFLLGAAWLALGNLDEARRVLGDQLPEPTRARELGGTLRSPVRETALLLSVVLDVEPTGTRVLALVDRLRSYRVGGRWGSTQENGFALLALGKYARLRNERGEAYTATVRIGDAEEADEVAIGGGESRTFAGDFSGQTVRIELEGDGTVWWFLTEEGVPLASDLPSEDAGLTVRRRYVDKSGAEIDGPIPQGDIVRVEISLEASRRLENVVITDLLPAGLEVENPRLGKRRRRATEPHVDELEVEHFDIRDDRVLLYIRRTPDRRAVYSYAARAVTRGEFALPPIAAECMYDAGIFSRHGAGRVEVAAR